MSRSVSSVSSSRSGSFVAKLLAILSVAVTIVLVDSAGAEAKAANPKYAGIVVDAKTGNVLYSENADRLQRAHAGVKVELVKIVTQGDKRTDVPLSQVGGKGLFVKEIEDALLKGEIDFAVHSLKDVPGLLPEGLAITVAWGLPYFRSHVEAAAERHLPVDRRASTSSKTKRALLDSIRFPSDPDDVLLEENDVAYAGVAEDVAVEAGDQRRAVADGRGEHPVAGDALVGHGRCRRPVSGGEPAGQEVRPAAVVVLLLLDLGDRVVDRDDRAARLRADLDGVQQEPGAHPLRERRAGGVGGVVAAREEVRRLGVLVVRRRRHRAR